jgi:hypothetical protein
MLLREITASSPFLQREFSALDPHQGVLSPKGRDFASACGVAFPPEGFPQGIDLSLATLSETLSTVEGGTAKGVSIRKGTAFFRARPRFG